MRGGGIPAPNAADADELQLLRAVRQGDAAAFQRLYARHRGGLYRFALMHSGRAEVAADVVQEVFMGLLGEGYDFDPLRGMLANFLCGVARKLLLRHAIAAGVQGNAQDIHVSYESWDARELAIQVYFHMTDPRNGERTTYFDQLTVGEPAAEVFDLPGGYAVHDLASPPRAAAL